MSNEDCLLFPAPWRVDTYLTADDRRVFMVRAADGMVILQPGQSKAFCEAIVRSRNEGTDAESIASVERRYQLALDAAREEVDRVRAHFRAETARALETNRHLQDAIVEARRTGSVLCLPAWCQPGETIEEYGANPKRHKGDIAC